MFAELLARQRGTQRALPLDMSETAAIETINVEQIATVTDLLLLRARTTRRRFSTNKPAFARDQQRPQGRGSRPSLSLIPVRPSRPSIPSLVAAPAEFRGDFRDPERTMFVRAREFGTSTASAAIVATAFAIAIVFASLL